MTNIFQDSRIAVSLDEGQGADLPAIARTMKAAQDAAQQLQPFTSQLAGFDVPAAYAVAKLLHETRVREGARPVGRKIGFTNYDMWSRYGVSQPIWAHMYDTTVRIGHGGQVCHIGPFTEPKIEPEIVVHFRSIPPVTDDVCKILECIDWVAHGFEIVQSHFPGWIFQTADTIVDCALHGTLLVGEQQRTDNLGPNLVDALKAFEICLYCDEELREAGRGSNVLGSPLSAVAHLIKTLEGQPLATGLQAGEIVTTGTITTAQSIRPGQTWRSQIRGLSLAGLSVRFEP